MHNTFDIQKYMAEGVENIVKDALRATLKNPRETAYLTKFALASKKASAKRKEAQKNGQNIPPFLIASITSSCNLHCKGCYSRQNGATSDCAAANQLSGKEWSSIFKEADELGISFILLAGGEPLLRKDVISEAATYPDILFPILTNGVFMGEEYINLFNKNRNLVPVMSIEGGEDSTDNRRGKGIYQKLITNMDTLNNKGILWGASVTVTSDNLSDVTSTDFLKSLSTRGCKAVIYVEYVPVTEDSMELALSEDEQRYLQDTIMMLRNDMSELVFISFPGDEKATEGCVAAGRGFFHINSSGGAEPCPFSPYSDINVREVGVSGALKSPLFIALQTEDVLKDEHIGGCTLFMKKDKVEEILQRNKE